MLGVLSSVGSWGELDTSAFTSGKQSEGYILLGWLCLHFCSIFYHNALHTANIHYTMQDLAYFYLGKVVLCR